MLTRIPRRNRLTPCSPAKTGTLPRQLLQPLVPRAAEVVSGGSLWMVSRGSVSQVSVSRSVQWWGGDGGTSGGSRSKSGSKSRSRSKSKAPWVGWVLGSVWAVAGGARAGVGRWLGASASGVRRGGVVGCVAGAAWRVRGAWWVPAGVRDGSGAGLGGVRGWGPGWARARPVRAVAWADGWGQTAADGGRRLRAEPAGPPALLDRWGGVSHRQAAVDALGLGSVVVGAWRMVGGGAW